MNPVHFVKEIVTLTTSTTLLKVAIATNRLAASEIKEAARLLESADNLDSTKKSFKHFDKGMKHAKHATRIRNAAYVIHSAPAE